MLKQQTVKNVSINAWKTDSTILLHKIFLDTTLLFFFFNLFSFMFSWTIQFYDKITHKAKYDCYTRAKRTLNLSWFASYKSK